MPGVNNRRHRVRVAEKVLRRLAWQQRALSTAYSAADSDLERFRVLADAVRAAAAPGAHQPPGAAPDLVPAITVLREVLQRLHHTQKTAAEAVLAAEEKRVARRVAKQQSGKEVAA